MKKIKVDTSDNNLDLLEDVTRAYLVLENSLPFDVYVAGGDNYGNGLEKYKKPHFHIRIEKDDSVDKFIVSLPSVDEWNRNKKLTIPYLTLKNYDNILEDVIIWMDKPADKAFKSTNIEMLNFLWLDLNEYNPNVEKEI